MTVPLAVVLVIINLPVLWFGSMWASVPEHRATPPGEVPILAPYAALPYYLLMAVVVVALIATIVLQARGRKGVAAWTVLFQLAPLMFAYV